ncbi:ATP-binding protein [Ignatzschineria rhizosphaerae]|uniref:ATP-binding protein n=1 Tax=Ignatzschineria rhizosphaerae TaxID=2923279 RepID=A0ABY3X7H5_9GAMM|nr:ATP-binding protein [Ignatzschineria rhizosphaerae]UNM95958.1 ATP-binding protein [Ignatzschineria rhizosphaerae]
MKATLSDQGLNSMKTNLPRISGYLYKNVTVNDVLKESVMNSIQANATQIDITLGYQYDSTIDGEASGMGRLNKISIRDNGDGLTKRNTDAFFEVATDNKAGIGGKGIGRISFLKIANRIEVESVSKEGKLVKFPFSFDAKREDVITSDCRNKDTYTQIVLSDLNLRRYGTQPASCVSFLKEKFNLMLFLKQQDTGKNISINVFVNNSKFESINSEDINYLESRQYESGSCNFLIYVFRNKSKNGIAISYCANNLQVDSDVVSKDFKTQYIFAITSEFLDENANAERTRFDFRDFDDSEQEDAILLAPNKGFKDELKKLCLEIVHQHEPDLGKENKTKLSKLKERYGYINFDDIDPSSLFFDEKRIIEDYRKKVNDSEDRLVALLDRADISIDQLASEVTEQNKHELAKYIFHRDIVAKKGLGLTGSKENEDILHSLFFPQKATAKSKEGKQKNEMGLYENSIWLLDDKFMSFVYTASDVAMKRIYDEVGDKNAPKAPRDRPDLFILYNNPEKSDSFKDVVLIEFKKGDINYLEKASGIDQAVRYKMALMDMVDNIRNFYCYIICDFDANDENLELVMRDRTFTKVFSNDGCMYYGYLPGSKTHITFISSKSIFTDAVARNETFLNILKNS